MNSKIIDIKADGSFSIKTQTVQDAQHIWDDLITLIDNYGEVTGSDLYELAGQISKFGDHGYGWKYLLRGVSITRVEDGFLLNIPKPIPLN